MTIQLTQAFNQFVNPWALDAIGWKYVRLHFMSVQSPTDVLYQYIVYCCWLLLELLFILRYIVETKGEVIFPLRFGTDSKYD